MAAYFENSVSHGPASSNGPYASTTSDHGSFPSSRFTKSCDFPQTIRISSLSELSIFPPITSSSTTHYPESSSRGYEFFSHPISSGVVLSSMSIDVKKIAADEATQEVLKQIFKSENIQTVWNEINRGLVVPITIIPLTKSECAERFRASSSIIILKNQGKLCSIRIYYDRELNKSAAAVSLINEIMNAAFALDYLNIFEGVSQNKIQSEDEFTIIIESLRWAARNRSLPIIEELGLVEEIRGSLPTYQDLEAYLDEQKSNGHMEHYKCMFRLFQEKKSKRQSKISKYSPSKIIKKPDVTEISKDPATQKILSHIFDSNILRWHWHVLNASLTIPSRVLPLSKKDCYKRFKRPSSMQSTIINGKISTIRIFYDKEIDKTQAIIALIFEIINATFAKKHQEILNSVSKRKITTKEEFAKKIETIEWMALFLSLSVIEELGLKQIIEHDIDIYKNLDVYLGVQKKCGHTKIYEDAFTEFQKELKKFRHK